MGQFYYLQEPFQNATVTIKSGMKVKLDADVDVNSIVIETNGRLVWDSSRDSIVRTHFIYIRGTMEIGSENCKFKKKAKIILKGKSNLLQLNEKGPNELCSIYVFV